MGFAFFKSFSIRGDSEHIPGFLAGCCIKYSPGKSKSSPQRDQAWRRCAQGVCIHSCCHPASLLYFVPIVASRESMQDLFLLCLKTPQTCSPHYRGFFALPFRACSHLGALFNPPTFKRALVKPRPCLLSPSFFDSLKQGEVKGCDVSHLVLRTSGCVALIRLPTGVLIVRFSVLSFALTHSAPEAGREWEIASGTVISQ